MINLIPNEERKKMIKDFYMRLVVMFFFTLGLAMGVASIAILPAYFMSTTKMNVAQAKLGSEQSAPVPAVGKQTMSLVQDINGKLDIIERAEKSRFDISEKVLREVIRNRMDDIKITQITYENNTEKGKKIGISGIAPSRERLLLFRKALEDDSAFSGVDLPISNFIKGSNIQFFLTLTPA